MNDFFRHIPFIQLADYLEGRLPAQEQAPFDAHLAACSRCANELAQLRKLIELMRTDSAEDAPPAVIARAVDLFRARPTPSPRSPGIRRQVLAILNFDSIRLAPIFGVRSNASGARQLVYTVETFEVDLRIEPDNQSWTISGQVFGECNAGEQIELQGERGIRLGVLNEQSEFKLSPVQAGTYRLILRLTNVDIQLDDLPVGM